jgi:hypothetical protein
MNDLKKYKLLLESIELMEYKRDVTAKNMGKKVLAGLEKDTIFSNKIKDKSEDEKIDAVLDKLEEMDPTSNKQFVQWLAKQYGAFRIEDGGRVKSALEKFAQLKTQIKRQDKSVDINSYSWHDFEQMIDEVTKVNIGSSDDNYDIEDVKVLYNGPYGKLLIPETKEASCQIGTGTKWCTAARNNNMFDYYTNDGPLFIWIDKSGDKYQFHFESSQYMDARDKDISKDKMKYFIKDHPVLSKFFKKFMNKDIKLILKYTNPDKDVQMAAVQQNGKTIQYIDNPDKDVQMAVVQQDAYAIRHIKNPDKDVQIAAVQQNGRIIKNIKSPHPDVQVAAILQNFILIREMHFDRDVIIAAIKQNSNIIRAFRKPDKDLQMAAVTKNGHAIQSILNDTLSKPDKDVQLAAVKQNVDAIKYFIPYRLFPDKDVQMAAVQQDGKAIYWIENPDKDVQMVAVKQNGKAIRHIDNPDKDVQMAAVQRNGYAIRHIDNPDKDVQMAAVQQDGKAIYWIIKKGIVPDKDVQLAAVQQDDRALRYIKNPHPDVVEYVRNNQ